MSNPSVRTRVALIALAALLALPTAYSAAPAEAKQRARTVTRSFANGTAIQIPGGPESPSPASALYYPSEVAVRGLKGTVRDVDVTLVGFSHAQPEEVEVLLVGPDGRTAVVMADAGGADPAQVVTLALDDEAAAPLPGVAALRSGAFRPTNVLGAAIPFNAPAPPGAGANAALSVFDSANANGAWRLFVQDENGPDAAGAFAGGWELEVTARVKAKKKRR